MAVGSTRSTGTGINVPEIVSGLMEVERAPVKKLETQIDQKTLVLSTLGVFKSKVSALESAAKAIQNKGIFSLRDTASTDSTKVSASASNAASPASYSVKVAQTAQAETSVLGGFASASQVVSLGSFALTLREGTSSAVTYSPAYAQFGATATYSRGDLISFALTNGVAQNFTVTSQTTPEEVASAINAAVRAGTVEGVIASQDASGRLQLSSENPLQGLTASLKRPGSATFGASAASPAYAAGEVISFTVSNGAEQKFTVTTQTSHTAVAAAINDAVAAGSLSGVYASVNGNQLILSASDATKTVSAGRSGVAAPTATSSAASAPAVTVVSTGLSESATLSNVATWINQLDDSVRATIVQQSSGAYALSVSSTKTGVDNKFSISGLSTPNAQKDEITLSGTFAVDDVISLTVNGISSLYKVTASDLTSGGSAVAGNSAAAYQNIAAGIVSTFSGDGSVSASSSASRPGVVTLTAQSGGTAFTSGVSVAKKAAVQWTSTSSSTSPPTAQVSQIQFSGTFQAGDTVNLSINGNPFSYTVTSSNISGSGNNDQTYANIASALAGLAEFDSFVSSRGLNLSDSASGGVFTLTSASGTPFTLTTSVGNFGPIAQRAASIPSASSPATSQVDTISLAGKYESGDVITLTVNGVALAYTVTSADVVSGGSTDDDYGRIAQSVAAAFNGSTSAAHTPITASASGATILLTADTAGVGFTAAVLVSEPAVILPLASKTTVVANQLTLGATAVGSAAPTNTPTEGDYQAIFDGLNWLITSPSEAYTGLYTTGASSGTLTLSSGAGSAPSITLTGIVGAPKAGDKFSFSIAGSSAAAVTLAEHSAIELQSSRDAFISVNGARLQRSSNQIDDVVSGVTFNLNSPMIGASGAVTSLASADFSAAPATTINVTAGAEDLSSQAVEDFVKAYNELISFYKTESAPSTDPEKRGVLNSDSTLRTFMERLRSMYGNGIRLADGSSISFGSIGIEVQRDGSLFLDTGVLNDAVANGLQDKFAAGVTLGYVSSTSSFTSFLTSALRTTGIVSARITDVEDEQARLEDRVVDWEEKLTRIQDRYFRQYAALDALLFRLQTTSNALSSAIESLVNSQKSG